MRKLYLAGPMQGVAYFNYPAFYGAAAYYRRQGFEVFNPAERDRQRHGRDISNVNGSREQATQEHGFSLRTALGEDLAYICEHATHICMLPGWENSKGARAEHATAVALDLDIIYDHVSHAGELTL